MNRSNIPCKSILNSYEINQINTHIDNFSDCDFIVAFLLKNFKIKSTSDQKIINGYKQDYSNLPGNAAILCRPENEKECAIILAVCQQAEIPLTISAGRTNLNGCATPNGGLILSLERMINPQPYIDLKKKIITSPVGIILEKMRTEVTKQSNNKLYFPVDPTSRNEAMIGGALSCNASGFSPGKAGSMRYWTEALDFLTPTGYKISCKRGQYISKNGKFTLLFPKESIEWELPTYPRPSIKNASGPYSDDKGNIDLVDYMVGSEGIFGLITSVSFKLKNMPSDFLNIFFCLPSEKNAVYFHQFLYNYLECDLSKITALEYFGYRCQKYMKHYETLFHSSTDVGIYMQIPLYNQTLEEAVLLWYKIINKSNCGINEENILLLNNPRDWKKFFEARHSIPVNALEKTHKLNTWSILTDTIVPPGNFEQFLEEAHNLLQKSKIEYLLFGHLGDCHLHFHLIPTIEQQNKAIEVYQKIVSKSAQLGGVYSAEHGTGKRKRNDFIECFGKEGVKQIKLSKSAVDPLFLLNRGNIIHP
tara:strand:- start:1082 stop:2680 length:1599 start_codon:yes stop_codon:yes gene_type:complete